MRSVFPREGPMTGTSWFSCIVTACAVLGFGVGNGAGVQLPGLGEAGVPDQRLELNQFRGSQACGALESYIADSFTEQFLTRFRCLGFGPCPLFLGAPEGDAAIGAPTASPVPERVSDTNTQESGVDEADIVKS